MDLSRCSSLFKDKGMPDQTRIVAPGPAPRTVIAANGQVLRPPADWVLLPPGDAGLTRRVKAGGPTWTVQEKRGRKTFSQGVWAPAARIEAIQVDLAAERSTEAYAKRRASDGARRERKQTEYVGNFQDSVLNFLKFPARYAELATRLSAAVTAHATPVGSGTVARTERIPIEQRAESAVIAWLRHQTTAYDDMHIPRVKGKRREVRRMLAEQSRKLLKRYREGQTVDARTCPLQQTLDGIPRPPKSEAELLDLDAFDDNEGDDEEERVDNREDKDDEDDEFGTGLEL
jgi:hypothetical protein